MDPTILNIILAILAIFGALFAYGKYEYEKNHPK